MSVIDPLLACSDLTEADIALLFRAPSTRSSLAPEFGCGASRRSADGSHFSAASATAEERVAAVGLEARHRHAGRHVDLLQKLAALRIDSAQFAFVGFPRAVPEFAIDPGDAGDETVRLDGAKDRAGLRIDLMDLAFAMLPDPEAPFCPRHSGGATVGCRDSSNHAAGCRIDLLDAISGDLVQVSAIEGGSRVRGDIKRAHRFP